MTKHLRLWAIIIFLSLCFIPSKAQDVLYQTNFNGERIQGSLDDLITAIHSGNSIRLGWQLDFNGDQTADLEHWIDTEFLTILEGQVFNQSSPIYRQVPNKKIPQVEIISSNMQWMSIIGTNGKMLHRYIFPNLDQIEDEEMRAKMESLTEVREETVATIWAIQK